MDNGNAAICWFDIPTDNMERAHKFYGEIFNWHVSKIESEDDATEYFLISKDGSKEKLCGGFLKRQCPEQPITVYFQVDSIDDICQSIKENGGKILEAKKAIPNWGYFAICLDTENNGFAIWECDKNA